MTTLQGLSPWARAQLSEELAIWSTLRHPHIVRLYGSSAEPFRHVLFLELCSGGELFERLTTMHHFCEEVAARQISQVLAALAYLHSFGVIHRDLKPENLLLASAAEDAPIKLADFGASKLVFSSGTRTPCGSRGYAAPEQLPPPDRSSQLPPRCPFGVGDLMAQLPAYDVSADLWAVGVIAFVLLCGAMPFSPSEARYTASSLAASLASKWQGEVRAEGGGPSEAEDQSDRLFPPSLFRGVSHEARDFVRVLLRLDPSARPTATEALAHAWLRPASAATLDPISRTLPTAHTTASQAEANGTAEAAARQGVPGRTPSTTPAAAQQWAGPDGAPSAVVEAAPRAAAAEGRQAAREGRGVPSPRDVSRTVSPSPPAYLILT